MPRWLRWTVLMTAAGGVAAVTAYILSGSVMWMLIGMLGVSVLANAVTSARASDGRRRQ